MTRFSGEMCGLRLEHLSTEAESQCSCQVPHSLQQPLPFLPSCAAGLTSAWAACLQVQQLVVCVIVHRCVLLCIVVRHCVPLCIIVCRCASLCVIVRLHVAIVVHYGWWCGGACGLHTLQLCLGNTRDHYELTTPRSILTPKSHSTPFECQYKDKAATPVFRLPLQNTHGGLGCWGRV